MTSGTELILNSPVARGLSVVGDRWAGLILRDAFLGVCQFEEFRRRSGAARGTLTSRLKTLVESDVLYRKPYQTAPPRYEYRLTRMGLDLYPSVLAVWNWETRWSKETHIPPSLKHRLCSNAMKPLFRCRVCHEAIRMHEVAFSPGPNQGSAENIVNRFQRRSPTHRSSPAGVDRRFFHVLDIIGDRWTGLVIAALYFGLNRYDSIGDALGIATNILADRLKLLVSSGIVLRKPYQRKPTRYEYRLTEKGADLYIHALQMHEWACRWLLAPGELPLVLTHKPCGHDLLSEVVCNQCEVVLKPSDVGFEAPIA